MICHGHRKSSRNEFRISFHLYQIQGLSCNRHQWPFECKERLTGFGGRRLQEFRLFCLLLDPGHWERLFSCPIIHGNIEIQRYCRPS